MQSKLLITGVNGYLGLHMAIQGLKKGYAIRGTVRSQNKANECLSYLKGLLSEQHLRNFETAIVDLAEPAGWDQAIKGCDAIMHLACPLETINCNEKKTMVKTVRNGIKHIFTAALRQNVTRVIYTSSVAAVIFGRNGFKPFYTEHDWTDPAGKPNTDYTVSKTLAEQDAWDFASRHSKLRLTTLLPGLVLGPVNNKINFSTGLVQSLMNGAFSKGMINRDFPIIDVRDVVSAHFNALNNDRSIGERIMLAGHCLSMREMAETLCSLSPQHKFALNRNVIPSWQLKFLCLFSKPLRELAMEADVTRTFCNNKAIDLLLMHRRSPRDSLIATAEDLIKLRLTKANP